MIKPSTMEFRLSIERFVKKAKERTRLVAVETVQDLNEAMVIGTGEGYGIKVVTGFLRGSWYASLNGFPTGTGPADPSGGQSVARMNLVAADLKIGDVFHAANGAAYAVYVHFGTARMAARPWVQQIMRRAPQIAQAAARRVARR